MPDWNESLWFSLLAGGALKSAAVLGAAWTIAAVLKRWSAASRRLIWTSAFVALLALPFLSLSLPTLRVPITPALEPATVMFQVTAVDRVGPEHSSDLSKTVATGEAPGTPINWRLLVVLVWAAGSAVSAAQVLAGWIAMWRVRRRARPASIPEIRTLASIAGIDPPKVLETRGAADMPMTFGALHPEIFVPAGFSDWSESRRSAVLLHEISHLRSGDPLTHLLARAALCLYWWNPLAWAAWFRFLKERERAADDFVLEAGARASEYATHLLEIARQVQTPPAIGWAAVAMAWRSQLEDRMLAILDGRTNRKARGRLSAVAACVAAVLIAIPLAALRAQTPSQQIPADVDATIRAAAAQKNHEILENAAKAAEEAQRYDLARTLLDSSLEIRSQSAGAQSVGYAMGLLRIADLERSRGNSAAAASYYEKAVALLGVRPEASTAFIRLGAMALGKKDYVRATNYFEQARIADGSKFAIPTMWLAITRQRQGMIPEAEQLYLQAISAAGPGSPDTATINESFSLFLAEQGRDADSKMYQSRAAEIRRAIGPRVINPEPNTQPLFRVGGGVTPPRLLSKVEPAYTEEARMAKYSGTVVLQVEVWPDGQAHNITVRRGLGLGLDEEAVKAVQKWRFEPGTRDGQQVPIAATLEVNFRLL